MENNLNSHSQVFQDLSLGQLWSNISTMGAAQLIAIVLIISLVLIFAFAFLIVITGNSDKVINLIKKRQAKIDQSREWPSEDSIKIHHCPEKLSYVEDDAQEYKKMILRKIENLRQDNYSGKVYIIDMSKIIHMSEPMRDIFKEIAEGSVKLNVVWLVYVIPKIRKGSKLNNTEQYFRELSALCKKLNKPGSWSIKEGVSVKLFG